MLINRNPLKDKGLATLIMNVEDDDHNNDDDCDGVLLMRQPFQDAIYWINFNYYTITPVPRVVLNK